MEAVDVGAGWVCVSEAVIDLLQLFSDSVDADGAVGGWSL